MLSTAASLASPFHSRGLPRRRPVGGSRWSGRCRTCSTPRGCPPGSPRSPRRPPAPRASPCWEGTAPLWACRSSAASEVQGPAASPGSLWWRSTGGGRVAHIRLDSHKAAAASLPPSLRLFLYLLAFLQWINVLEVIFPVTFHSLHLPLLRIKLNSLYIVAHSKQQCVASVQFYTKGLLTALWHITVKLKVQILKLRLSIKLEYFYFKHWKSHCDSTCKKSQCGGRNGLKSGFIL